MINVAKTRAEQKGQYVIVENESFKVEYDLSSGYFDFVDKKASNPVIERAFSAVRLNGSTCATCDEYSRKWECSKISDNLGNGIEVSFTHGELPGKPNLIFEINLYDECPFALLRIAIDNTTGKPVVIDEFQVLEIASKNKGNLNLGSAPTNWSFYKQGQISFSPTCTVTAREAKLFEGYWMGAIKDLKTQMGLVAGFVTLKDQLSKVRLQVLEDEKINFSASSDPEEFELANATVASSECLLVGISDRVLNALEAYGEVVKEKMKATPWPHVPAGWCSWYYYHTQIDQTETLNCLEFFSKNKDRYPIEYFQIDVGYYQHIGDWTSINPKFPKGMRWIANQIKTAGLKPGLWLPPFWVGSQSNLYKNHPDWVIKDKDDKPVVVFSGKDYKTLFYADLEEDIYCLDASRSDALKWLRELFSTIFKEWGYDYVKIDFLHSPLAAKQRGGIFSKLGLTSVQVCRKALDVIRKVAGPNKYILGCGAPVGPCVGVLNAIRIDCDTAAYWAESGKPSSLDTYNEPGAINAIRSIMARYFMNRRFFINDPDCMLVRDIEGNELQLEEVRSLATVMGLSGGVVFLSEQMVTISSKQEDIYPLLLPPYGEAAIPVDLFENQIPRCFLLHIDKDYGNSYVVGVFNWEDRVAEGNLSLEKLGIEQGGAYHVFDFWEKKYLGTIIDDEITLPNMPPHSAKLLAIRPIQDIPQLLSTSLHITQGGMEIPAVRFDTASNKLTMCVSLPGKREGSIFVYVPSSYKETQLKSNADECTMKRLGENLLCVDLKFSYSAEITVAFSKQ